MLESIRVLDSLCSLDEALVCFQWKKLKLALFGNWQNNLQVPKLFPIMKKLFNIIKARSVAETTNTSQSSSNSSQMNLSYSPAIERIGGLIDLALLQFFLNHSEKVVYDPEPLFRSYFETCLSNNCKYFTRYLSNYSLCSAVTDEIMSRALLCNYSNCQFYQIRTLSWHSKHWTFVHKTKWRYWTIL